MALVQALDEFPKYRPLRNNLVHLWCRDDFLLEIDASEDENAADDGHGDKVVEGDDFGCGKGGEGVEEEVCGFLELADGDEIEGLVDLRRCVDKDERGG